MKLLYLASHVTMEYDELSLFSALGIDCFSVGAYIDPQNPIQINRKPLGILPKPELINNFKSLNPKYQLGSGDCKLSKELVKDFDVVFVSHNITYVKKNWDVLKDKFCIWRTFGQGGAGYEQFINTLRPNFKIVRTSPKELLRPKNIGADAIIRASCDPEEFKDWNGSKLEVLTAQKHMQTIPWNTDFVFYEEVTRPFARTLMGLNNQKTPFAVSNLSYEELLQRYRDARVYYSSCSKAGHYTYTFMEAWMTGTPVVTIGPDRGDAHYPSFEQHELIENGVTGFWSDDKKTLQGHIRELLDNEQLAAQISAMGRKRAIELFGFDNIKQEWKEFFQNYGLL